MDDSILNWLNDEIKEDVPTAVILIGISFLLFFFCVNLLWWGGAIGSFFAVVIEGSWILIVLCRYHTWRKWSERN